MLCRCWQLTEACLRPLLVAAPVGRRGGREARRKLHRRARHFTTPARDCDAMLVMQWRHDNADDDDRTSGWSITERFLFASPRARALPNSLYCQLPHVDTHASHARHANRCRHCSLSLSLSLSLQQSVSVLHKTLISWTQGVTSWATSSVTATAPASCQWQLEPEHGGDARHFTPSVYQVWTS